MKANKSILSDLQMSDLEYQNSLKEKRVDLSLWGNNKSTSSSNFILSGNDANSNRVLFWLASKRNDYVRSDFKGGVLYDLLGELGYDTNLEYWENRIRDAFNNEFGGVLSLVTIKLSTDRMYRKIKVLMIVKDIILNKVFTVSTEAKK